MKTVQFAKTEAPGWSTPELLRAVLENDGTGRGITLAEQRRRMRVLDLVDAAKDADSIQLEDADYDLVKALYSGFPFRAVHPMIVQTADAIDAAT